MSFRLLFLVMDNCLSSLAFFVLSSLAFLFYLLSFFFHHPRGKGTRDVSYIARSFFLSRKAMLKCVMKDMVRFSKFMDYVLDVFGFLFCNC